MLETGHDRTPQPTSVHPQDIRDLPATPEMQTEQIPIPDFANLQIIQSLWEPNAMVDKENTLKGLHNALRDVGMRFAILDMQKLTPEQRKGAFAKDIAHYYVEEKTDTGEGVRTRERLTSVEDLYRGVTEGKESDRGKLPDIKDYLNQTVMAVSSKLSFISQAKKYKVSQKVLEEMTVSLKADFDRLARFLLELERLNEQLQKEQEQKKRTA